MTKPSQPQEIVDAYVESVVSGDRVVGTYERHAVDRYRHDQEHAYQRGWYFDTFAATHAVSFFPDCMTHSLGEWADEPFELSPWQTFLIWNLHGWRSYDEKYPVELDGRTVYVGARRFRKAFVSVARKNGKTSLAAAEAAHLLYDDLPRERGGRGFCAATKQQQALLAWSETQRMVSQSDLDDVSHILGENSATGVGCAITVTSGPQTGSVFVPLGSDSTTQDGLNPSFVIKDEIHEWRRKHRKLNEKLSTGGASRRQPLELIITTAGDDDSEIWEEESEFACRVVEAGARGHVVDDTVFAFICTIDEDDDPLDEACWPKANPNIDISCKRKYLQAQANEAREKPSALNSFIRYNTNRRVGSFEQAYPSYLWNRGNQSFPEPKPGDLCFASFDIGRTNDWAAWAAVFPQQFTDDNGAKKWRNRSRSYVQ